MHLEAAGFQRLELGAVLTTYFSKTFLDVIHSVILEKGLVRRFLISQSIIACCRALVLDLEPLQLGDFKKLVLGVWIRNLTHISCLSSSLAWAQWILEFEGKIRNAPAVLVSW